MLHDLEAFLRYVTLIAVRFYLLTYLLMCLSEDSTHRIFARIYRYILNGFDDDILNGFNESIIDNGLVVASHKSDFNLSKAFCCS